MWKLFRWESKKTPADVTSVWTKRKKVFASVMEFFLHCFNWVFRVRTMKITSRWKTDRGVVNTDFLHSKWRVLFDFFNAEGILSESFKNETVRSINGYQDPWESDPPPSACKVDAIAMSYQYSVKARRALDKASKGTFIIFRWLHPVLKKNRRRVSWLNT